MLKTTVEDPTKPKEKFFTKKKVVRWVATSSVRFVVVGAVNAIVPAETKVQKVRRFIGSHILAEMVVEHVVRYIDGEFDEVAEEMKEAASQALDIVDGVVEGEVVSSSVVQEATVVKDEEIIDAEIVEEPPVTSTV